MTSVVMNQELKGVEIYFDSKPIQNIIDSLKSGGYRWHNGKHCWYAKQNTKTLELAKQYEEGKTESESAEAKTILVNTKKESPKVETLWNLTRWTETKVNDKQSTKEIAAEIRKHVRNRFPMCKFSVTSDYSSISFYITSSPFAEGSEYLKAITEYCDKLVKNYQRCICYDPYGDYGSSYNFYGAYAKVAYDYKQTEQTEAIKADMLDFDTQLKAFEQAEEERKEAEYQEYKRQQEEDNKAYQLRQQEEAKEIELINNSVNVQELTEDKQYFVVGSQVAHLNKNNTLDEYKDEVAKGEFSLQNVKITKEVHFTNAEALNYFSNLLLTDFDFLSNTGGSYTDDVRVNTMTDYYNMTKEEQESVIWNLLGVAVYYNNQLQFVVDAQGHNYARYVGLVDNVKIQKNDPVTQFVNPEEIAELKTKAETLEDYSVEVITDNNLVKTWDNENWQQYKELMKTQLKTHNFRLTKAIIQQLDENAEKLKVAMYKLLTEVDGIQDQFANAELRQGQKLTLVYMSDLGGIITRRITFDKVENSTYAQYDNAVKLTFKQEGKRGMFYTHFYSTLLVYNGWLNLPETVLNTIDIKNGMIITSGKYLRCDNKQYDAILEHFAADGIKPVINTYKPMF